MHSIPIIFTFWPGLPQLWLYGRWFGLLKATVFAAFLNFVLIATYVQPELISKVGLISCWIVLGLVWTVAIFRNDWVVKDYAQSLSAPEPSKEMDELFEMAQSEYLRGHFNEAENLLERLIWLEPRDLDARLYLATIYRHQGRLHQAEKQFEVMETLPDVTKWRFQIEEERELIAKLESELQPSKTETAAEEIGFEDNSENEATQNHSTRMAA